jgi:tRNA G18 (ribose-2'-O)-methylase SpoU
LTPAPRLIIPVSSADDPRITSYLAVKERDLVRRDRLFIVEGKVTLSHLVEASRFAVESVFVTESRLEPLAQILAMLDPAIPVYVAPQEVMDRVAGFHLHRGVLALARRSADQTCEALIAKVSERSPATLLALVDLSNHDNVGACFRNAAALGADGVLLDAGSCDPLYRKSIRVSVGTALSLPYARSGTGEEIIVALQRHGFAVWALAPAGGEPLPDLVPPARLALMLGAEGPGLPAPLMAQARRVSIPMAAGVDSLNVATAGAIALAHVLASRSRRA